MTVLHAVLLAFPHPGMPATELNANSRKARDVLTKIHDIYRSARARGENQVWELRDVADDPLIFVQLAKMWQADNITKAVEVYQSAIEIQTRQTAVENNIDVDNRDLTAYKLSGNLGSLYLAQRNIDEAMQMFEQVLSDLGEPANLKEEILQTTLLYNLGRAYEEAKDEVKALEAYRGLLAKHPEFLYGESI